LKLSDSFFFELGIQAIHQMSVPAVRISQKIPGFGFVTVPGLAGDMFAF
jgi:hypothetical protein